MANIDKEFKGQVNTAWGLTIQTTNKVPEVAKRIFKTKNAAEAYVKDINDTAIEGLILTVVEDGANNGAYFVKSIKTSEDENGGELVKLSDSNIDTSLYKIAEGRVEDIPEPLENKIYLIKDSATGDSANTYIEYIYVKQDQGYVWEKLGEYKATIELDNVLKTDKTNQIEGLSVSFTGDTLYAETAAGNSILELGADHGFISVNDSAFKVNNSGATIIGTDEVVISSGENGNNNINKIKINSSGTTLSRENADIIVGDDKINIQGYNNVTIGYKSEKRYMSISGADTIITRDKNAIILTDDDLEIDIDGGVFGFNSSGATFPKNGLTVGGTPVSLDGHNHDDLYYTETEVDNLLKDKLDATTDGGISVNEIVHLGGVFDEETKDSLILRHGEGDERRIKLTSTGINFEVNYEYTDENEDKQSVATIVTINDTLRVGGTPVSLEGHTHNGLEKIAQLEATIATMQQTIVSLQQQIESLTTGQGIVTPQNIGRYAVTSIETNNNPEDMEIIHSDDYSGVVSITLKGISNIAFDEAIQINGENTAQF